MKEYKRLKEDEIKGLHIIEQAQFELYVDMVLQKNYKGVPNVIRLPNISEPIAKMLGSSNMNVYLTKNDFTHFRISRKGTYNQAFRVEELKAIPQMIKNACTAYIDKKPKHQNFFVAEIDKENSRKVNILIFNKDTLGSYVVTVKKIDVVNLKDKDYERMAAGVAPAISSL